MTRNNAEEDRLDGYAKGVVALLDNGGNGDARPPVARAQSFRMLSDLVALRKARARSRRILDMGIGRAVAFLVGFLVRPLRRAHAGHQPPHETPGPKHSGSGARG